MKRANQLFNIEIGTLVIKHVAHGGLESGKAQSKKTVQNEGDNGEWSAFIVHNSLNSVGCFRKQSDTQKKSIVGQ